MKNTETTNETENSRAPITPESEIIKSINVSYNRIGFNPETEQTDFVVIVEGARGRASFKYHMGIGCTDKKKEKLLAEQFKRERSTNLESVYRHIKQGHVKALPNNKDRNVMRVFNELSKIAAPKHFDILYSVSLDSSALHETFSDWCANFGYDEDSRKALATYDACRENGLKFQKALSKEQLEAVQEACQDY